MKQHKFGQKIQNWHRPLGPSQLRQRFLRHRYGAPSVSELEMDEYYAYLYWHDHDDELWCVNADEGDADDVYSYELSQLVRQSISPLCQPLFQHEWATDATVDRKSTFVTLPDSRFGMSEPAVEDRLAEYVEDLESCSKFAIVLRAYIKAAIGDPRNVDVVKRVATNCQIPDLAKLILLFSPFWVRSPLTWNEDGGETAFLDHLFANYDVPGFLRSEWFREEGAPRFKWLCWFILLAQGGSLKRAAGVFGWRIQTGFPRFLWDVPDEASPTEACLLAEIKRLGGCERDFARILRNPAFVIDPTDSSAAESHASFWQDTVRWLISHGNEISDEESDLILSWAMHEYTEAEREGGRPFSWKGRHVRAVLERSIQYRRLVMRPWSRYRWSSHGWDWVPDKASHGAWSYIELTSGDDLYSEGAAMRHCVASYAARCATGSSAIVSIRYENTRRITVEINPKTLQVVQARGLCNRQPVAEELDAISRWLKTVVHGLCVSQVIDG